MGWDLQVENNCFKGRFPGRSVIVDLSLEENTMTMNSYLFLFYYLTTIRYSKHDALLGCWSKYNRSINHGLNLQNCKPK